MKEKKTLLREADGCVENFILGEQKPTHLPVQESEDLISDWLAAVVGKKPLFTFRGKRGRPFIRGPIPLGWMKQACRLNAAPLALYIWWKAGMVGASASIALRPGELAKFGQSRYSIRRQYKALVGAKLLQAVSEPGKCKAVRLLTLHREDER